jgi:methyl-accepting chemotaxis protein
VPTIRKTSELIREINASSAEQATGIDQTTTAIHQLDHVIQQNAASAEEMTATSAELAHQSDYLRGAAAFFKIPEGTLCMRRENLRHHIHARERFGSSVETDHQSSGKARGSGINLFLEDDDEISDHHFKSNL